MLLVNLMWLRINNKEKVHVLTISSLIDSAQTSGYEISNLLFSFVNINLKSKDTYWKEKNEFLRKYKY